MNFTVAILSSLCTLFVPAGREERVKKPTVKSESLLSIVALVVAIGTASFTYLQVKEAERARQQAHDDAMRTLKQSYRPYISVQGSLEIRNPAWKKEAHITLQFTGMGASPALDAAVQLRCIASQKTGREIATAPDKSLETKGSHYVLFPGTSVVFHCKDALPDADAVSVFAVGQVTYTDVFGESHKTAFCLQTVPQVPGNMLPCRSGGNSMN